MNKLSLLLLTLFSGTLSAQTMHRYTAALPATDELKRTLPTHDVVGDERPDRFVGMFYWTWHTNFANYTEAFDVTKFLHEHPYAIHHYDDPAWGGRKITHFWGEPLFGYYRDTDEWVLRKHAEMLGEAGVDVLIFDCTNGGELWTESYMKLCEVFMQAREDGVHTPQIAFLTAFWPHEQSRDAIRRLYNDLYKPGRYRDLWFMWKGRPLLMASKDGFPEELKDFFTIRQGQPVYQGGRTDDDHWGWLEIYPQNGYNRQPDGHYEEMPVGVAQNWSAERGLTAMNAPGSFGRSYTHQHGQCDEADATLRGLNFQEQWDRAIAVDPEFVFVTGWNEWIAGRYDLWQQQHNAFPDEFSQEKSRDIEPMRGGYGDNYYYQLIANIRRYKGMPKELPAVAMTKKKINWDYWQQVDNGFRTHRGNTIHRDSRGWGSAHLVNTSGRNDIIEAKVAHDRRNLYFFVACAAPLTQPTDSAWMRLLIDVDSNHQTGWEGYDYIVNRLSPDNTHAFIEKNLFNSWSWYDARRIDYHINQNQLMVCIPKTLLGIKENADFCLQFKWADNTTDDGDIVNFLVNGDVAPLGRFNYPFRGIVKN